MGEPIKEELNEGKKEELDYKQLFENEKTKTEILEAKLKDYARNSAKYEIELKELREQQTALLERVTFGKSVPNKTVDELREEIIKGLKV